MSVGANPGGLGKVNAAFAAFAERHALPDDVRRSLNVALDELLANALSHGAAGRDNGSVSVAVELERERVNVRISDDGPPFDPFKQAAPDTTLSVDDRAIGGLGIHLVREMMDEVSYQRDDGHNVVLLVKRVVDVPEQDSAEAG
jgi:anti-sigma regulatory factor (Ser/Thr protein kinase)